MIIDFVQFAMKDFSMIMEFVKILTVLNSMNGSSAEIVGKDLLLILEQESAKLKIQVFAHKNNTLMKI